VPRGESLTQTLRARLFSAVFAVMPCHLSLSENRVPPKLSCLIIRGSITSANQLLYGYLISPYLSHFQTLFDTIWHLSCWHCNCHKAWALLAMVCHLLWSGHSEGCWPLAIGFGRCAGWPFWLSPNHFDWPYITGWWFGTFYIFQNIWIIEWASALVPPTPLKGVGQAVPEGKSPLLFQLHL